MNSIDSCQLTRSARWGVNACVGGGGVLLSVMKTQTLPLSINECRAGCNVYLEIDLMTGSGVITDVTDNFKLSPVVSSEISK